MKTPTEKIRTILRKIDYINDTGFIYFYFGKIGDIVTPSFESKSKEYRVPEYVQKIIQICEEEGFEWEIEDGKKGPFREH